MHSEFGQENHGIQLLWSKDQISSLRLIASSLHLQFLSFLPISDNLTMSGLAERIICYHLLNKIIFQVLLFSLGVTYLRKFLVLLKVVT